MLLRTLSIPSSSEPSSDPTEPLPTPTQLPHRPPASAPGCLEPTCALCQHSTSRRCGSNFARKYVVGDSMLARCGAVVRLELLDRATGAPFEGELPGVRLEVAVLDGAQYEARYLGEADR